ncbi:single-stranded-DNA-specific exonuclease RecJ [Isosphaeraceae bacterium EP7]
MAIDLVPQARERPRMLAPRWRFRPFDRGPIEELARESGLPPLLAHLLWNRGIRDAITASEFLEAKMKGLHDPESLPGIVEAADRIVAAVRANRKVVIYGDYDVDGVCGTSILWHCLKLAGATNVEYYIPHRVEEGYGVSADALRKLAAEGAELVVTVDCGISAVAEAELARELGLEFIVTDHHTIGDRLPEAAALVHPKLIGSQYPFPELCGCGVAFKLAWQMAKTFGDGKKASPHMRGFLINAMGMVAMATVADMVPLFGENRVLVKHGLDGLNRAPSAGLQALIEVSGLKDKLKITSGHVGFTLGPRINAAGRLERAMHAVEMLTTDDAARAMVLARGLDECNVRRREVEARMVAEARSMLDELGGMDERRGIVLAREGWHPGVIGIVAGRIAEMFHRPTVIIALDGERGQGSARSIPGFNLYDALKACGDVLSAFGGHSAAAGVRLPAASLPQFTELFDRHCRDAIMPEALVKELSIDAEIELAMLTIRVAEQIEALEPHGIGNLRPILATSGVRLVGDPKTMTEGKHIKLRVAHGTATVEAVGWNMGERYKHLKAGMLVDLAYHPAINEWNGRRTIQLEIKDIRLLEGAAEAEH